MQTLLDVHTHTIVSGHAFCTLNEMIAEAQKHELTLFGVTEHGPAIPGTCTDIYFRNLHVVPRQYGNMRLLLGAELNIIEANENIFVFERYLNASSNNEKCRVFVAVNRTDKEIKINIPIFYKDAKSLFEKNCNQNMISKYGIMIKIAE